MGEKEKITRAAGVVGSATLLSRIFGLVRDLVTAYFFGADMVADAFFVAFRIPNLLRRLVAEGALTVAFIPIFTEYLSRKGREDAFAMARACMTLLSILLAVMTITGVILSPWIVRLFAPGFGDDPEKLALTVFLTKVMFPYIFLIGLVALAMGVLNSLGKFAAPALAPVFLNLGMIGATVLLAGWIEPPILALAIGVLVGGLLQVLLQLPSLHKEKGLLGISFEFRHPSIRRIGLLMAPAALGAAVYQFSIFVNTFLASFLPQGSVSYLYYADRVMQFPLGVFAIAIGTAVLPTMSRQAAAKDLTGLKKTLSFSLRLVFFITIPAIVGMTILAEPIITLLFQRGRFDLAAARATSLALIAYAAGLWALSAVQIVVRVFYSMQDTRTPMKIAVISLLGNIVLSLLLMGTFKHIGLALASSGGSMINFILLVIVLRKRLGGIEGWAVWASIGRNILWAAVMGSLVFLLAAGGRAVLDESVIRDGVMVLGGTLAGLLVYLGLALVWRAPEAMALKSLVFRRSIKPESSGEA